jgi:hypothetical protein
MMHGDSNVKNVLLKYSHLLKQLVGTPCTTEHPLVALFHQAEALDNLLP